MERKIDVNTDKVWLVKDNNWGKVTSVDFGGINFRRLFSDSQYMDACVRISNGKSAENSGYHFYKMNALEDIENISFPNINDATLYNCFDCPNLKKVSFYFPNALRFRNTFYNCPKLEKVKISMPNNTDGEKINNQGNISSFYCDELPISSSVTLDLSNNSVDYDSFVYMAIVNPNAPSQEVEITEWIVSEKKASNTPSNYKAYKSDSNYHKGSSTATTYVTFTANGTYDIYINSFAESSFDYTIAYDLDGSTTEKANTKTYQYNPTGTIETNYKKVTYTIADGNQHTAKIVYVKDGSADRDDDRGYILVPNTCLVNKEQKYNGCTLNLSNASKAISATTDVQKYWNMLDKKGYHIQGYTPTTTLPKTPIVADGGVVELGLLGTQDDPTNLLFGTDYECDEITVNCDNSGWIQIVNASKKDITITIGDKQYTIESGSVVKMSVNMVIVGSNNESVLNAITNISENNVTTLTI